MRRTTLEIGKRFAVLLTVGLMACEGRIFTSQDPGGGTPLEPGPQTPGEPPPEVPAEPPPPCTEFDPAPSRVIRLSRLELQNTLDVLYGQSGATDVPADSRAFGFSTGDQQTYNAPFAEGLQRTVELRGAALRTALTTSFTGACVASESAARGCAETQLRARARLAFRRPPTDAELTELLEIYDLGRDTVAETTVAPRARAGLDYAYRALGQSPSLLYRTELGAPGSTPGQAVALTDDELAAAVSYTVLAAPPDEALLTAASEGRLADPAERRAQARRLSGAYPTLYARQLERFVTEWLQLDFTRPAWAKNQTMYPGFTAQVRDAIAAETSLDLADWARAPRLDALLTRSEGHVSALTAGVYGVTVSGTAPQKVSFDPAQRAGILTSAAFLGTHAHTDGSAPIFRAVAMMRGVLCVSLPNPPANVAPLPTATVSTGRTTRETVDNHIRSGGPACQGCHALINPMGFTLEAYDGVGRFRTMENGFPVDSTGAIVGTPGTDQLISGPTQLASVLAASADVHRCFTKQTFRYTFGRFEGAGDRCTLGQLERDFTAGGLDTTSLLESLVATPLFGSRKAQ